jgi:uncharacterized protein
VTIMMAFIAKHAVPIYVAVTFGISWASVLLVIGGPSGLTGTTAQSDPLFPLVYLAMLVGPSVAGVLLTALVHGRAGLLEFRRRLVKWQVAARWYAVALLTAPLLACSSGC